MITRITTEEALEQLNKYRDILFSKYDRDVDQVLEDTCCESCIPSLLDIWGEPEQWVWDEYLRYRFLSGD